MDTVYKQKTIQSIVKAVGVGLHSGQRVELCFHPAKEGTGIVFRRTDLIDSLDIPVNTLAVTDTRLATTIGLPGQAAKVQTIEHFLCACSGLGIDNLYVDINAEEMPILDGSAASFVYLLQSAGLKEQAQPRQYVKITKTIQIIEPDASQMKWARLEPYEGFKLSFGIDFSHPAVDATDQEYEFDLLKGDFKKDIARARTFGFTREVEGLRAKGLVMGGGYDNAIVMDDYRVLNAGGLRMNHEFVKHKILDAMGDLYCFGKPLLGKYSAFRSGHALNNALLRRLLDTPDAYEIVSFPRDLEVAPNAS